MQTVLRQLPQIDKLLRDPRLAGIEPSLLAKIAAHIVGSWRMRIKEKQCKAVDTKKLIDEIIDEYETIQKGSLQPVINATGITVHTNLGRSAMDSDAFEHARKIALGYCNLEYDLEKGCRGDRYSHLSALGKYLFEEYEVLLVNNNAAAVYLILNT
ncbi:MAG: L-seryl-tRNA(Sec) selenium transferase, partial [Campylobacterota bacterium]